jgi:hypothetical protein
MTCKTCKWLDVPADKRGRIVVRDTAYKCIVPMPVLPALPDCVTKQYGYHDIVQSRTRFMIPTQGATCPLHEERKK